GTSAISAGSRRSFEAARRRPRRRGARRRRPPRLSSSSTGKCSASSSVRWTGHEQVGAGMGAVLKAVWDKVRSWLCRTHLFLRRHQCLRGLLILIAAVVLATIWAAL